MRDTPRLSKRAEARALPISVPSAEGVAMAPGVVASGGLIGETATPFVRFGRALAGPTPAARPLAAA